MLIDLERYPLYQIARELGEERYLCKENLLCLLSDGKITAHICDKYFIIDIPPSYWDGIMLDDFTIFKNIGLAGREYFLKPTKSIIREYVKKLEFLNKSSISKRIDTIPENLWNDIIDQLDSIDFEESGNYYINNLLENGITVRHTDEYKIKENDWHRLPSLKEIYISEFIKNAKKLQIYVEKSSWTDYCRKYKNNIVEKNKGGRKESVHWRTMFRFVMECIVDHEKKKLSTLLGMEKHGQVGVSIDIHNWISIYQCNGGDPNIKPSTIQDMLVDIEKPRLKPSTLLPFVDRNLRERMKKSELEN